MAWCFAPIQVYRRGTVPVLNEGTGRVEWPQVACGSCRACIATRKNDWTGRLCAEAADSKAVYFLTLTYKQEPRDDEGNRVFYYKDIQRMLYLLRAHLVRRHGGAKVRYFVVGEYGELKGRIHWHMMLFFDRNFALKQPEKRKLWEYWPHGWTKIERVPAHDTLKRARYVAKYAVKGINGIETCRPRFSTLPALGAAWAVRWAQDCADAALPFRGTYVLPGHVWSKGHRVGQHIRYRLRGSVARKACHAYLDRWIERKYAEPWESTSFMRFYCPEQLAERIMQYPHLRKAFQWHSTPTELEETFARWKRLRAKREAGAVKQQPDAVVVDNRQISSKLCVKIPEWESRWYKQQAEHEDGEWSREAEETKRPSISGQGEWDPTVWRARVARDFRHRQCDFAIGFGPHEKAVQEYIETCALPLGRTPAERAVIRCWDAEGGEYNPANYRASDLGYFKEQDEIAQRLFAEYKNIRDRGFSARERIDPETGEVGYEAVAYDRNAANPNKKSGPTFRKLEEQRRVQRFAAQ